MTGAPSGFVARAAADIKLELAQHSSATVSTTLHELSKSSGVPIVLDFFAPWCKACPAAAKHVEQVAQDFAGRCLCLLICVDGGIDAARDFAAAHGLRHCALAAVDDEEDLASGYGVHGLPHKVLISAERTVVKNYDLQLPSDLDELLRTSGASAAPPGAPLSRVSAEYRELEKADPLLQENPQRWVMFPIKYPGVWE
eukprot:CAMPEP_0175203692 /NCGR_PEP_ID=MMETSP0093-20121207/11192_1 /TAXON_ID=311494 /ORGANISM="Alexandrium monilatum, Strain CCMP3105" /LENGTH=197 /DNA_ID=CAMNT_0016496761 /DNA_START=44 /DNA_END=634 /DNA_ORIENTATION=+